MKIMRPLSIWFILLISIFSISICHATTFNHDSKLNVSLAITALGGGSYRYTFSFTNSEPSNIWHFLVWTNGPVSNVQGSFQRSDNGHAIPVVSSNYSPYGPDPVIKEYDARNLDSKISWYTHMNYYPFAGGGTGLASGKTASFSFTASFYKTSFFYGYETLNHGWAGDNFKKDLAAVGTAIYKGSSPVSTYNYKYKMSYHIIGGVQSQSHAVSLFYDPVDKAMVIEVRADHRTNWDDIIMKGAFAVYVPNVLQVDYSKMGLYVSRNISLTEIDKLANPWETCFYEAFNAKFSKNDFEQVTERVATVIDDAMTLGILAVEGLGKTAVIGPARTTWEVVSNFLDSYYYNSGWSGDRNGIYPQFILTEKQSSTNLYWGNKGRILNFSWEMPSILWGLVDAGYQVVTIKIPILNWQNYPTETIQIFGQFKVHDAWDKPWVTLFSKEFFGSWAN